MCNKHNINRWPIDIGSRGCSPSSAESGWSIKSCAASELNTCNSRVATSDRKLLLGHSNKSMAIIEVSSVKVFRSHLQATGQLMNSPLSSLNIGVNVETSFAWLRVSNANLVNICIACSCCSASFSGVCSREGVANNSCFTCLANSTCKCSNSQLSTLANLTYHENEVLGVKHVAII